MYTHLYNIPFWCVQSIPGVRVVYLAEVQQGVSLLASRQSCTVINTGTRVQDSKLKKNVNVDGAIHDNTISLLYNREMPMLRI